MQKLNQKQSAPAQQDNIGLVLLKNQVNPDIAKEKIKSGNLPWIGSYFGIPEPEHRAADHMIYEEEMHVLYKDLSSKVFTLRRKKEKESRLSYDSCEIEDMGVSLSRLAWQNPDAVAFKTYSFLVNPATGERTLDGCQMAGECIRVGKNEWKWTSGDKSFTYENPYR